MFHCLFDFTLFSKVKCKKKGFSAPSNYNYKLVTCTFWTFIITLPSIGFAFAISSTDVPFSEGCISSLNTITNQILNTLNSTSCVTLHKEQEVVHPEVIPLHINRACVNGSHVSFIQLFFDKKYITSSTE